MCCKLVTLVLDQAGNLVFERVRGLGQGNATVRATAYVRASTLRSRVIIIF